jgi:hypothetical protein
MDGASFKVTDQAPSLTLPRSTEGGKNACTGGGDNAGKPPNASHASHASLLREAKRHHKANRLAEAERLYRLALERKPEDAEALHFFRMLQHQRGHAAAAVAVAVELLYQAVAFRPDQREFRAKLGQSSGMRSNTRPISESGGPGGIRMAPLACPPSSGRLHTQCRRPRFLFSRSRLRT